MSAESLHEHLRLGTTTVARCWSLSRKDGKTMGFTDHDLPIEFEGMAFEAASGFSARALQQGTGLAVDNSEAIGALSHFSIKEEDVVAGRYDGADVRAWLVNWANPDERKLQFRGTIGEIKRVDGQFTAELRGLTEALNQPRGRTYQRPCTAVLGDKSCGIDLSNPGYCGDYAVAGIEDNRVINLGPLDQFDEGWFTRGTLTPLEGAAEGLVAVVKEDKGTGEDRRLTIWSDLRAELRVGEMVKIVTGCDRATETCKLKFNNFLNFRGFPDIPGEDWLMSYPARTGRNDGGRLT